MTVAPAGTALRVRTRPLRLDGPLLDVLPRGAGALSWVRGDEGIVGWGEAARFTASGPGRFAEADRWWRSVVADLEVDDDVRLPGTGAVAFTSFTFDPASAGSVLVVPRVVVGRRGHRAWVTEISTDDEPPGAALPVPAPVRPGGRLHFADGDVPAHRYRGAVGEAVRRMRAGELDKVVLAHDLLAHADADLDTRFLLGGLARRFPTCWTFAVDGLVGATPELLLRLDGPTVESRVLAGTMWPSGDGTDVDSALAGSAKDRREHAYAVDSLAASLRPLVTDLRVPDGPSVLTLPNVSHLASDVTARLDAARPASLLTLLGAVHPTAAVGGTPTPDATALITEIEGLDRGRYAGPVGYVDADGGGETGIALRCAELRGRTARLFAGCGIVADSDPDAEVREAAAKMRAVREALEG
ncbi:Menaquinone-specific isochorismate synthase [Pseudonocardia sp. Ae168_Ps1]|uniref:isochorismate synthase n=1 Tax=unclassified Pseudonocardia TaxID=2619320 RepID=UPI0006CB5748|nr:MULTISPECIES: isochorismate synthase [unclassified Pseudonocardia]ALE72101.1 isochorismate synthase [Pseudonocardia sp. EC080625-04]ALL75383.1 isochorismate synthase [Pseudonocardia sp. EC080610-09]ALL82409.1 isochorismate synthase [Pseudonocardia sp. EC080619-01]OLL74253.1 Menaquinone-specific isochorismate synthase [Pseudonocardia sp. Ae150A_Ps1]OLL80234.1 Menaquinone-specific isochorismate synthase [Pseudonocardia sp. Ae168_Ps1]